MEARGIKEYKECLIPFGSKKLLPTMAIYGKNGGGKSNVLRAFWLGVKFICNAQKTQHENSPVPVSPFLLDNESKDKPTSFEFYYTDADTRYRYGFSATRREIVEEHLYSAPKGQRATIFTRQKQNFYFPENAEKKLKELIKKAVAENQLFFSVACTMNYMPCIKAMNWFRNKVIFTRDYTDLSQQIIENSENGNMLNAILTYAKKADVGIEDMKFEISSKTLEPKKKLPEDIPDDIKTSIMAFLKALSASPNVSEIRLQQGEMKVTSFHKGINKVGKSELFPLSISDESDGTRRLMALAPAIERALECGGIIVADELETGMHPLLAEYLVSRFQNKKTNPNGAQMIFTTHDTNFLNLETLRRDQFVFVDKDADTGESELYGIDDIRSFNSSNAEKSYLLGKFGAVPNFTEGDE
jgi:hypothetical protein